MSCILDATEYNATFSCLSLFHTCPSTSAVPGPVSSIAYNVTNTTAVISWKEPDEPNGEITGYTLYYYKTDGNIEGNSMNSKTIKELSANEFNVTLKLSEYTSNTCTYMNGPAMCFIVMNVA